MKPQIHKRAAKIPPAVLDWAQQLANDAYPLPRTGSDAFETAHKAVCAVRGAVKRHNDGQRGVLPGMRAYGVVLRSDGHVLHTETHPEGVELTAGDLYIIDPLVDHWTTVSAPGAELIFSVYIMLPDGRSPKKMAHDITWEMVAASIDAFRASRSAG